MRVLTFVLKYYELLKYTVKLLGGVSEQVEPKRICKAGHIGTCEVTSTIKQIAFWVLNVVNSHIEL
jgi:hypothetical protein